MRKGLVCVLVAVSLPVVSANALEFDVRKEFRFKDKSIYKLTPYESLNSAEKKVINIAVTEYAKHTARCGGKIYYQKFYTDPIQEIKDGKETVFISTEHLSPANKLNGITWIGSVGVAFTGGVFRNVYKDGSLGEWVDRNNILIQSLGASYLPLYKFEKNILFDVEKGKEVVFEDSEYDGLNCNFVKERLDGSHTDQVFKDKKNSVSVLERFYKNWEIPKNSYLYEVDITIHVDKNGRFVGWTINKPSNSTDFDNSVVKAFQSIYYEPLKTDEKDHKRIYNFKIKVPDSNGSESLLTSSFSNSIFRRLSDSDTKSKISNDKFMVSLNVSYTGDVINGEVLKSSGDVDIDSYIMNKIIQHDALRFRTNRLFNAIVECNLSENTITIVKKDDVNNLSLRPIINTGSIEEYDLNLNRRDRQLLAISGEYSKNLDNYEPTMRVDVSQDGDVKATIIKSTGNANTDSYIVNQMAKTGGVSKIKRNGYGVYAYHIKEIALKINNPNNQLKSDADRARDSVCKIMPSNSICN